MIFIFKCFNLTAISKSDPINSVTRLKMFLAYQSDGYIFLKSGILICMCTNTIISLNRSNIVLKLILIHKKVGHTVVKCHYICDIQLLFC